MNRPVGTTSTTPPVAEVAEPIAPVPPLPPSRRKPSLRETFVAFQIRDFRYLAVSTLMAGFAQWAKQLALVALAYDMTGSAVQLGAVAAFRGSVGTIVAPMGGYLSDRFPRRVIIVASTLLDAALAIVLAGMVIAGVAEIWHVYVIAFGGGLAQSINMPARQAFIYDVTTDETLPNAIAVNSLVQNAARVLGPSAIGVMMAAWGVSSGLIALFVLQLATIVPTLMISQVTRQETTGEGVSPVRMIAEGFRYCWQDRQILGLVVLGMMPSLIIYPYIPFLKVVAEEVLHQGNAGFGLLSSMVGWGSVVGLFALAYLGNTARRGRTMLVCYIGYASFLIAFSLSGQFYLSLLCLAIAGVFDSVAAALRMTLLQQITRNDMRGRILAVTQMSQGLQPLGSLPMAFAISSLGAQIGLSIFMVIGTVGFVMFMLLWTSVRRM